MVRHVCEITARIFSTGAVDNVNNWRDPVRFVAVSNDLVGYTLRLTDWVAIFLYTP